LFHLMHRVMPALLVLTGLAYFAFAWGLDQRIMPGDPGYDPGSRALPIFSGLFLAGIALVLFVRDSLRARPPTDIESSRDDMRAGSAPVVLSVIVHLVGAVLLLAGLTTAGFLVASAVVLSVLLLENRRMAGDATPLIAWVMLPLIAAVGAVALYAGMEQAALTYRSLAISADLPSAFTGRYAGVAFSGIVFIICAYALPSLAALVTRLPPSVCITPILLPVAALVMFNQIFLVRLPTYPAIF
jgi:hypothetical protein